MLKISLIFLLLSIPLLSSKIYYGLPLWVYASLGATIIYSLLLVFTIEKRWHTLKDKHE